MVNFNYEYKTVNTKDIFVDTYQRKLDRNKVRKIVANFNNNIMNPIKVSYRDGKYFVFDGQHTEQALILMNDGKDTDVYCKVSMACPTPMRQECSRHRTVYRPL